MKPTCGPLPWAIATFQPSLIIVAMWRQVSPGGDVLVAHVWCVLSLISELPPMATTAVRLAIDDSPRQLMVSAMTAFWPCRRFSAWS